MKYKLPKNAKRVFQGITHDVYHWEQEMFDGSFKTFEALKRSDTSTIIPVVGNKILVQEQKQPHRAPFLSLPGGRSEDGEDIFESAKRELLEETGHTSEDFFLWKTIQPSSTIVWDNYYFIARSCQKKQEPKPDNGEKIVNKLINFEDFLLLGEDEKFRHKDLRAFLYRLRLYPEEKENFRKLLFE